MSAWPTVAENWASQLAARKWRLASQPNHSLWPPVMMIMDPGDTWYCCLCLLACHVFCSGRRVHSRSQTPPTATSSWYFRGMRLHDWAGIWAPKKPCKVDLALHKNFQFGSDSNKSWRWSQVWHWEGSGANLEAFGPSVWCLSAPGGSAGKERNTTVDKSVTKAGCGMVLIIWPPQCLPEVLPNPWERPLVPFANYLITDFILFYFKRHCTATNPYINAQIQTMGHFSTQNFKSGFKQNNPLGTKTINHFQLNYLCSGSKISS